MTGVSCGAGMFVAMALPVLPLLLYVMVATHVVQAGSSAWPSAQYRLRLLSVEVLSKPLRRELRPNPTTDTIYCTSRSCQLNANKLSVKHTGYVVSAISSEQVHAGDWSGCLAENLTGNQDVGMEAVSGRCPLPCFQPWTTRATQSPLYNPSTIYRKNCVQLLTCIGRPICRAAQE